MYFFFDTSFVIIRLKPERNVFEKKAHFEFDI